MTRFLPIVALLAASLVPACGAEEASNASSSPLTEARVRGLVAEATSVSVDELTVFANNPGRFRGGPLAFQMLMARPRIRDQAKREADWKVAEGLTGAVLMGVMTKSDVEGEGGFRPRPVLIQRSHIDRVTVAVNGTEATGDVSFRIADAYEGTLRYHARRDDRGTWRLVQLTRPVSGVQFVRNAGGWYTDRSTTQPYWMEGTELPTLSGGAALPAPSKSVEVTVDGNGYLRTDGVPLSLRDLERELADRAEQFGREPDGSSGLPVVLRIDNGTCWRAVAWIMQSCASMKVKMYRMIFAGTHDTTNADVGIEAQLPKDRGLAPTMDFPEEFEKLKLKFFAYDGSNEDAKTAYLKMRRAIYARVVGLAKAHVAAGMNLDDLKVEFVTPPPKGGLVHAGYIIQALDAVTRAGLKDIIFEGQAMPLTSRERGTLGLGAGRDSERVIEGDPWTSASAFSDLARVSGKGHVKVKFNNLAAFLHSGSADGAPIPASKSAPVLVSQAAPLIDEELEETEEETQEIQENDILAEEPVIKDEEIADHVETDNDMPAEESFGETEGLSDAPFEGPANNGTIGLGGGAGGTFKGRGARPEVSGRKQRDDAVDRALHWLKAHQSSNGGWEAANFGAWCDGKPTPDAASPGPGKSIYDPGVSGLALCAFLGAGYTNRGKHSFKNVVSKGLRYLKNIQDPEGCFGARAAQQYIYNHGTAALAMVEAYGMTGSPIFKGSAQRSLEFIALCRNPYFAWRYGIKPGDNDTSVTGWMLSALHSARLVNKDAVRRGKPAPLVIDESAFDGIKSWLDKVTDPDTGKVGYLTRGTGPARPTELLDRFPPEKSESMTAVGILARVFTGEDPAKSALIQRAAALCSGLPPTWNKADGSIDMYYWYYGTLAMYQLGGKHWERWLAAMTKAMVDTQRTDTTPCEHKGSWDPLGPWGADGGRVYSTAMMALCLEGSYRYERIFNGDAATPTTTDPK